MSHDHEKYKKEAVELFKKFIEEKGLSNTQRRLKVVEAIYEIEGHFDVEELEAKLKGVVNRATIYRCFKLLLEAGLISKVRTDSHIKVAYEHTLGHSQHDHLVCHECGSIIEFYSKEAEKIFKGISKKYGFELINHNTVLTGICESCKSLMKVRKKSPSQVIHRIEGY